MIKYKYTVTITAAHAGDDLPAPTAQQILETLADMYPDLDVRVSETPNTPPTLTKNQ